MNLCLDYDTRQQDEGTPLDGIRDWAVHAARRKPWAQAMSSTALKGYDAILVTKVHELAEELNKRATAGEIINISDWMSYFGYVYLVLSPFIKWLKSVANSDLISWDKLRMQPPWSSDLAC